MACETPAPPDLTPAAVAVLKFFDTLQGEDDQSAFLHCMGRIAAAVTEDDQAAALADFKAWLESRRPI